MINILKVMVVNTIVFLVSGCATNLYPGGATPSGIIFSSTKSTAAALAVEVDPMARATKIGMSTSFAILGLVGLGDSSITKAMEQAGIARVHHVDYENKSFLAGIYISTTTIVYGE